MLQNTLKGSIWKLAEHAKDTIDSQKLKRLLNRGMKIGKNFYFSNSAEIDGIRPDLVSFGDNSGISTRVKIFTHDATTKKDLGVSKFAEVIVGNNVFIGSGVIILPGTYIGDNVIIGAGSVVKGNVESNSVYAGVPARKIMDYDKYIAKEKESYEKHGRDPYYINGIKHFYDD